MNQLSSMKIYYELDATYSLSSLGIGIKQVSNLYIFWCNRKLLSSHTNKIVF